MHAMSPASRAFDSVFFFSVYDFDSALQIKLKFGGARRSLPQVSCYDTVAVGVHRLHIDTGSPVLPLLKPYKKLWDRGKTSLLNRAPCLYSNPNGK